MQIKHDARVVTTDGKDVGHVDRVVMDPRTREITHLIVRKGWLFAEDKVLPYEMVDHATEDEIILRADVENLDDLPPYQETYYVPIEEADPRQPVTYAPPYYYYPWGAGMRGWGLGYPYLYPAAPDMVTQTQRNVPNRSVALKDGAKVISSDDQHIGDVEKVISDSDSGQMTHFVVSQGILLKEHKLIPEHWVSSLGEDEVHLAVRARVVENLPDYESVAA